LIAYIDSSALLRVVFGEPGQIPEWRQIERGVVSDLLEVECRRTIDRMRLHARLTDAEVERRLAALSSALVRCERIALTRPVLKRAAQPFPTTLGTLDAIHLASALLWAQKEGRSIALLTHGKELGRAARTMSLEVFGC
jgi:predicted nucleic acid-binding protein